MYRSLLLLFLLPTCVLAQMNKDYQGLLWKISGNGLEEPSYLYGTMHVSNRVAFHLSETFFDAIDNADIIALETNPERWVMDLTTSQLYQDFYETSFRYGSSSMPLYRSFIPEEPEQQDWEYYLARDQDILNGLLYRLDMDDQDFAENTFLDMLIYQAGKKGGKKIVPLEDYEESFKSVLMSNRRDEDAVYITEREARELLGDFPNWQMLMEDGYRRGDLDLLDTITSATYPGKYYRLNMLDIRNEIMVEGMDSLMREGVLFTGVGAAHLPGKHGVISLLRERGYTVEAEERAVTATSISRKEEIDEVIFVGKMQEFVSDDGFIRTQVPGEMTKLLGQPFQEYVYADMANGGFYSLRRIPTFGPINGKGENQYLGKIDSMLFENIPGKILSKDTVEVSGFPALDIRNETRTGDHQHYRIVFTPLEVLIFKVGGNNTFAQSELPNKYFESIRLNRVSGTENYTPRFGGFEIQMPGDVRTEQYEGVFENPHYTFWAQSYQDGDYYVAGLRQYNDFDYIEEDDFELRYLVEKMAEEEEFELDSLYIVSGNPYDFSRFVLTTDRDLKLYGEVHLQGPKYVMLMTNTSDEKERKAFFSSFSFTTWKYEDEFVEYTDSVYHVSIEAPMDINNYESFFERLYGYQSEEDHSYQGERKEKILTYAPTGEQLMLRLETLHKFSSHESLEEFWQSLLDEFVLEFSLNVVEDTTLFTKEEDNYLSQAKLFALSDTNSRRVVKVKAILENGALYSLIAVDDSIGYESAFADRAFESFRTSGDTVIGLPITYGKADLFFDALDSRDSVRVYEASNSVYTVEFGEDEADRIKDYVQNYTQEGFDRTARLNLLNRLSKMEDVSHIDFLENMYYEKLDSSKYLFEILETLLDFNSVEGVESFGNLILDEPPFTTSSYSYNALFARFNDSLELAPIIYPNILTLADFEDYRGEIYELLSDLLDSGLVQGTDYLNKYETLLLFAKVELKKQHASDEVRSSYSSPSRSNPDLVHYTKLLTPFVKKEEVQEHFRKILSIRNKQVLADLLVATDPYLEAPDSSWNFVASDAKAFYKVYPYLREAGKLAQLDEKYQTREALAKAILMSKLYRSYDSISFIRSEEVEIKPFDAEVFFFRAQNDDDKLWKLLYLVVEDKEELTTDYVMARDGESYNESAGNLEEIIEDTIKEIKLYDRGRVVQENQYNNLYY